MRSRARRWQPPTLITPKPPRTPHPAPRTPRAKAGSEQEKRWANIIYPVRKNGNYLLCCLLVGNVLTNNTLAILLEQLAGGVVAIVGSTASIVVFGEIIPQAICGRFPLRTGAYTIYMTWFFCIVLFPVAYPVSMLLDAILGNEIGVFYNRGELTELIKETQSLTDLERDELGILGSALSLKDTYVEEVMAPIQSVFMLDADTVLDHAVVKQISRSLYSRVPVFSGAKSNVIGIILVHDVLLAAGKLLHSEFADKDQVTVRTCVNQKTTLPRFLKSNTLKKVLLEFKAGESHMGLVFDSFGVLSGVITMSNLTEHVLSCRIPDEKEVRRSNVSTQEIYDRSRPASRASAKPWDTEPRSVRSSASAADTLKEGEATPLLVGATGSDHAPSPLRAPPTPGGLSVSRGPEGRTAL